MESKEVENEESVVPVANQLEALDKEIADPIVYQLVRVDGDGRLVPATQDEIMAVEGFLEDDKCEPKLVPDTRQTSESFKTEGCLLESNPFQAPEGKIKYEDPEVGAEKSNVSGGPVPDLENIEVPTKVTVHELVPCSELSNIEVSVRTEKLQPCGMDMATRQVRSVFDVAEPEDEKINNDLIKTSSSPGWTPQPLDATCEKEEHYSGMNVVEIENDTEVNDCSEDNSEDNVVTLPTPKGGMRRKHHRPWTINEVVKLVEGVARYGAGRWSEIKRHAFASCPYRTSVDLKDKWRNLLKATFVQLPAEQGMLNSRKQASIPIPAPILSRVRELADMQGQVPPIFSSGKSIGHSSSRSVHEARSGYL